MYVHGFRFYFTPLTGVLFAFPSRYWFTIGQSGVFSLGGWSPHIQTGYHVSRLLDFTLDEASLRGYHPVSPSFPACSPTSPSA
ncbi:serine acetyltransferase [Vibrio cholerae CP1048(21)]|nr:serine acetyltransferase [Vibrio cholerae CP1048(21)]